MEKQTEKDIIKRINSNNPTAIDEAIEFIREEGGLLALKSLMDVYEKQKESVQLKIAQLFNDLRNDDCIPLIIEGIQHKDNQELRKMLITSAWQSRLNFIQHLEVFILIVIKEPFMFSFEAFTVIENNESKVSKDQKSQLIDLVKTNIGSCLEENQALAHDLVQIIESYEEA